MMQYEIDLWVQMESSLMHYLWLIVMRIVITILLLKRMGWDSHRIQFY